MTTNLSNLFMLSENISRSISAENPHGEKGKGAMEIPADEANPAFDLAGAGRFAPVFRSAAARPMRLLTLRGRQ